MPSPFQPKPLYDAIGSMIGGANLGESPLELALNTMAGAINTTISGVTNNTPGTFGNPGSGRSVTHRPCYYNRTNLISWSNPATQAAFQSGNFQGCTQKLCLADSGQAYAVALVSGRLFVFPMSGTGTFYGQEVAIPGGPTNVTQPQAWLWQSECWVIVQDGMSQPIFLNLNTLVAARSNYGTPTKVTSTLAASLTIPAQGATQTVAFTAVTDLEIGTVVTINQFGIFTVTDISSDNVTLLNVSAATAGKVAGDSTVVSWTGTGTQLPPGRMGCYGMGRNWLTVLNSPQSFMAGDIVGGSSGTQAFNFRDAVLNSTENDFIVGGGNFVIPGTDPINSMIFVAIINAQLGQGPLMVGTANAVWSCQAPVDRLTWQSLTNPILTEALIAPGPKGQWSTVLANGDMLFRANDGIRSLILAQLDFDTWGNVPCSFEVNPVLDLDDPGLFPWSSSIVFQNRFLSTVGGVDGPQGVYWQGIVPLNFDPISSLRGKAPAVWDAGLWTGMNVMQLTVGEIEGVERAFAFVFNTNTVAIEFWEILKDGEAAADYNGTAIIPITWQFDTASLRFGIPKNDHQYMYLSNGEIWISNLIGTVTFQIQYRPDQYPCWTNWAAWQTCQTADATDSQPGFLPRMGLGEPSPAPCDAATNRPLRDGFTFQTRNIIQGHCVFLGAFYEAMTKPQPKFAKMVCSPICGTAPPPPAGPCAPPAPSPQYMFSGNYGGYPNQPNFRPAAPVAIAFDTSDGSVWNWYLGAWH